MSGKHSSKDDRSFDQKFDNLIKKAEGRVVKDAMKKPAPPAKSPPKTVKAATLADQINAAHARVEAGLRKTLEDAKEAGALLTEAKRASPVGGWEKWASTNLRFGLRQAQNYMRLAANWDEIQARLTATGKDAPLGVRGALALLTGQEEAEEPPLPPKVIEQPVTQESLPLTEEKPMSQKTKSSRRAPDPFGPFSGAQGPLSPPVPHPVPIDPPPDQLVEVIPAFRCSECSRLRGAFVALHRAVLTAKKLSDVDEALAEAGRVIDMTP